MEILEKMMQAFMVILRMQSQEARICHEQEEIQITLFSY